MTNKWTEFRLHSHILFEKNELIRSWMLATIYTYDFHFYKKFIYKKDVGLSENTVHLLTNLFHRNEDGFKIDKPFINKIIKSEKIIDKFWLTFYYKYRPYIEKNASYKSEIPKCYISELTNLTSSTNTDTKLFDVEEYALSALNHNCPNFSFERDVNFNIEDIQKRNRNPRKWAYTLLWKDSLFIKRNIDFIKGLMFAKKMILKDREGFAKGLLEHGIFNNELEDNIIQWYLKEDNPIVIELLGSYMKKQMSRSNAFSEQVKINSCKSIEDTKTTNVYYN